MLVGALAFWFGAVKRLNRPVLAGLLGVLLLTFAPLVISPSLLGFCNSLLIGWLVAAALWLVLVTAEAWGRCEARFQSRKSSDASAPGGRAEFPAP